MFHIYENENRKLVHEWLSKSIDTEKIKECTENRLLYKKWLIF